MLRKEMERPRVNTGASGRVATTFATRALPLALTALLAGAAALAQPVTGKVVSAGLPVSGTAGNSLATSVYRGGQWTPILLELTANGSEPMACRLRIERMDLDGDLINYYSNVTVTPNQPKRVWCYVAGELPPNANDQAFILSGDGSAILSRVDLPDVERVANDHMIVLDMSDLPLPSLGAIETASSAWTESALSPSRKFYRSVIVARMPPRDLPDRWFGLESVDWIIWDDPNPAQLDEYQQQALIDWVRAGGRLLIGSGSAWPRLRGSKLAEILPVEGDGATAEVSALPFFLGRFAAEQNGQFRQPVTVSTARARRGFRALNDRLPDGSTVPLVVEDVVGSGKVVVTAASLRDLTTRAALRSDLGGAGMRWWTFLLDLNRVPEKMLEKETEGLQFQMQATPLAYPALLQQIQFQETGSLFLMFAFGFVIVYIAGSTLVSWWWLKRRGLTQHSWTAFAGFAVAASLLSVGAVQLTRGFTTVRSVTLLDVESGSPDARAIAYFGYRSPRRQYDRLSIPGEGNYLRPLATTYQQDRSRYATPMRYAAEATRSMLDDVPMRATLKQFEGAWQGKLSGSIAGSLVASRTTGRLLPESYLVSSLDFPFRGGVLLYLDPRNRDEFGGVPRRAFGLTTPYSGEYRGATVVPPAINVLAVQVGEVPAAGRVGELGARRYREVDALLAEWRSKGLAKAARPDLDTLWDVQLREWMTSARLWPSISFGKLSADVAAGLLVSTRGLFIHNNPDSDFNSILRPFSTEGLVDRDISHWLTSGHAVLLLWTDRPGPVQLYRDDAAMRVSRGWSLFRVRVPIRFVGEPPAPEEAP